MISRLLKYLRLWPSTRNIHRKATLQGIESICIAKSATIGAYANLNTSAFGLGRITVGERTSINEYAILHAYGGSIEIGNDCSVNPFCVLYGHGGLRIGDSVRIATQTVIIPANHSFIDISTPIYLQPEERLGIVIEDDVWIGAGAKILDGVTIGTGSVVGAGSVVTKSIAPYSVACGVPAKVIGVRK